jgi:hypothetical protein
MGYFLWAGAIFGYTAMLFHEEGNIFQDYDQVLMIFAIKSL